MAAQRAYIAWMSIREGKKSENGLEVHLDVHGKHKTQKAYSRFGYKPVKREHETDDEIAVRTHRSGRKVELSA